MGNNAGKIQENSYVCVVESLKHAGLHFNVQPRFSWIDSESLEDLTDSEIKDRLGGMDAIVVPQGWGRRGVEGKIKAAKYARENKLPYLGLCFGMQMASIEFGRNAVGLKKANSSEVDPRTPHPVIHIMPNQRDYLNKKQYGGTIRLGAWPCVIRKGTLLEKAYKKFGGGKFRPWYQPNPLFKNKSPITNPPAGRAGHESLIFERHRHRYEFNNKYKRLYEKKGFVFSGTSPDGKLVEAIELKEHPFFVGTQFHPEYLSRPLSPHPIFLSFIEAIVNK
ncbi:MAG: CTP synthase [Candidatus Woesebacteria bacterium GW2011_GWB1_39_10b]|uniref:CTP synthase (glutamine hydrolyzing) n=1 Tax=Candidatus Woesebacteria bacterium GW2011_GWB1_39_10b TaxID=1618573 RepID=A0A0G0M1P8_9BACT|nr:MAG: CTP synthase [Candidatus Woesebacteria bacterium GW2011_GWB1_39_10b]